MRAFPIVLAAAGAVAMLAGAAPAHAQWYGYRPGWDRWTYVPPPRVWVAPRYGYVAPPPVVVGPPPVVVAPPAYTAPAPVYAAPPVVYGRPGYPY